jgi:uncharacterized protein
MSNLTASPSTCITQWRGETVHLLPQHAVWWPAGATLLVADVHLGKAASYRKLGQPVPAGTTQANLDGLSRLLAAYPARQLVFLGDFLHAASSRTASLLQALTQWRAQHQAVAMTLVRGNHDDRAGDPPAELRIAVVDEPWLLGPFACCHHPQTHPTHFVLAGHVHPARFLGGPGRDRLRLPCFVSDEAHAILPAYGAFTGGQTLPPRPGQQWHAVGGGRVWRLP